MAWYQRNYFNFFYLIILTALIILLNEFYFIIFCVNFKGVNNLVDLQYNNTLVKYCNQIHSLQVQRAFDASANFIIQNPNYNVNICKYLWVENNFLYNFHKKSLYNHLNVCIGKYNNIYVNLQLTHHQKFQDFTLFSDKDVFGKKSNQFICNNLYFYSGEYAQLFYNSNALQSNNSLNSYKNFENFIPESIDTIKSQNFINQHEKELRNNIIKGFNLNK